MRFDDDRRWARVIPKAALLSLIAMLGVLGTASSAGAVERVQDGGFEATTCPTPNNYVSCTDEPFWTESETEAFVCNFGLCSGGPATGSAWATLGGRAFSSPAYGTLTQSLEIPDSPASLSFNLRIVDMFGEGSNALRVTIDGLTVFSADKSTAGYSTYAPVSRDVSAAAGPGLHQLQFFVGCSGSLVICDRFDIDDVSLTTPDPASPMPATFVNPTGPPVLCKGRQATIVGTAEGDELVGTGESDVVAALDGDDQVSGLGGNDVICGGGGRDKLRGGKGKDKLLGQRDADRLKGGKGNDTCKGGNGRDVESSC